MSALFGPTGDAFAEYRRQMEARETQASPSSPVSPPLTDDVARSVFSSATNNRAADDARHAWTNEQADILSRAGQQDTILGAHIRDETTTARLPSRPIPEAAAPPSAKAGIEVAPIAPSLLGGVARQITSTAATVAPRLPALGASALGGPATLLGALLYPTSTAGPDKDELGVRAQPTPSKEAASKDTLEAQRARPLKADAVPPAPANDNKPKASAPPHDVDQPADILPSGAEIKKRFRFDNAPRHDVCIEAAYVCLDNLGESDYWRKRCILHELECNRKIEEAKSKPRGVTSYSKFPDDGLVIIPGGGDTPHYKPSTRFRRR